MAPKDEMSSLASPSVGSKRYRGAWARELLREVWTETPSIPPGRYCAYNAFLGLILSGLAFVMWIDRWPVIGSTLNAGALGAIGIVLLSGIGLALLWPAAVTRMLVVHGVLILILTLGFLGSGIEWALAPRAASFRYLPGPVLMGMSYGALQVAEFGPWSRHSKRLRVAGFIAGICGELVFAACVVLYLSRGHR